MLQAVIGLLDSLCRHAPSTLWDNDARDHSIGIVHEDGEYSEGGEIQETDDQMMKKSASAENKKRVTY